MLRWNLLLKGVAWTTAGFAIAQFFRLATNIVLARLLAPQLFGIMQIYYSLRTGADLLTDVGIGQNIIYSTNANDPDFYNTAWTLQLIRSFALWLIFCGLAIPIAKFYQMEILGLVMPIASFTFILGSLSSISPFLLQKRMQYSTLTLFELVVAFLSGTAPAVLAYFNPTIWSLVVGSLIGATASMIGSYLLMPDVRQRLFISMPYAKEIASFGKWIFASSMIYFLATNFDRLYLAKVVPLAVLGVYGISRSFSDLVSGLSLRLGSGVIFPFISSHSNISRNELHLQLAPMRMKFLLLGALGLSLFTGTADLFVKLLYDQRYHAASWMLPILLVGAWFSIIANINESTLLGLGRPHYSTFANAARFGFLFIGLTAVPKFGILVGIAVIAASDLFRYVPLLVGQIRERFSFFIQDIIATAVVFGLVFMWEWLRWKLGLGTSFDEIPL